MPTSPQASWLLTPPSLPLLDLLLLLVALSSLLSTILPMFPSPHQAMDINTATTNTPEDLGVRMQVIWFETNDKSSIILRKYLQMTVLTLRCATFMLLVVVTTGFLLVEVSLLGETNVRKYQQAHTM